MAKPWILHQSENLTRNLFVWIFLEYNNQDRNISNTWKMPNDDVFGNHSCRYHKPFFFRLNSFIHCCYMDAGRCNSKTSLLNPIIYCEKRNVFTSLGKFSLTIQRSPLAFIFHLDLGSVDQQFKRKYETLPSIPVHAHRPTRPHSSYEFCLRLEVKRDTTENLYVHMMPCRFTPSWINTYDE